MNLILQKDVKNLGKAGDRVKVRPGYGRNYLLPKKLALVYDESKAKEWKHKQQITESKKKKAQADRRKHLDKLSSIVLTFVRESREEGALFGSVSPFEISKELEIKEGLEVDKKDIKTAPLKEIGTHKVLIELDADLKTEVTVEIKRKVSKEKKAPKSGGFFSRFKKSKKEDNEEKTSLQNESGSEASSDMEEDKKPLSSS